MKNASIIWSLTSLMISVCMAVSFDQEIRDRAATVPLPFDQESEDAIPEDICGDVPEYNHDRTLGFFPVDIAKAVGKNADVRELGILSQVNRNWHEASAPEMENRRQRVAAQAQLVNELESIRTIALEGNDGLSFDGMKDVNGEIEHYLNGFVSRLYHRMGSSHNMIRDGAVKLQIEDFAIKLAQHRATYPRPPLHRLGLGDRSDRILFDAFIRMRDDNMKILRNRMSEKDHIMFEYGDLYWEREAVTEVMWIMEQIGIFIGYPGMQEMNQKFIFGRCDQHDVRIALSCTGDFLAQNIWYQGIGDLTMAELLSRNSCIGVAAKEEIVKNFDKFVDVERMCTWRRLR